MLSSLVRPAVRYTWRSLNIVSNHHSSLLRGFASVDKWGKTNDNINALVVNIVEDGGNSRTDVPIHLAIEEAQNRGLDLVQVSPEGKLPTVCKLFDTNKRAYELKKASKSANKQQKAKIDKEVVIGATIAPNDLNMKVEQLKRFLNKGHKVKVTIKFARAYHLRDDCLEQLERIAGLIDAKTGVRSGQPKDQHGGVYVYYSPLN